MREFLLNQHKIMIKKCDRFKVIYLLVFFPILLVWLVTNLDVNAFSKSGNDLFLYIFLIWIPSFIFVYLVVVWNIDKLKFVILPQYRDEFF